MEDASMNGFLILFIIKMSIHRKRHQPIELKVSNSSAKIVESQHSHQFEMIPRMDPFHKLLFIVEGKIEFQGGRGSKIEQLESSLHHAGDILFIPANTKHQLKDIQTATILVICVGVHYFDLWPVFQPVWHEIIQRDSYQFSLSPNLQLKVKGYIRSAMQAQEPAQTKKSKKHISLAEAKMGLSLMNLIWELYNLPVLINSKSENSLFKVQALKKQIDTQFYENWNIDKAAHHTSLSRRRFTDLFKQLAQCSFNEYLLEKRLEHAIYLLDQTQQSVTAIAFSCGFEDLSHFYKCFKKRYSLAPGVWKSRVNSA